MFGKILTDEQKKCLVWDVERGAPNEILERPWQSCSCIGGWHYNTSIYEGDGYKSAAYVVKLLVDIVSKNGNLLLSVPLRADGTFDEKEEKILNEFRRVDGREQRSHIRHGPWAVFGEGPVAESDIPLNAQGFNEGSYSKAGADEIRFTSKAGVLYAVALGWPEDGKLVIKSLAEGGRVAPARVESVELLGYGKVAFSRTVAGLEVSLPAKLNDIAPVLKIK